MKKSELSKYFSKLGKKGGAKSRRTLTPEQARAMVEARETKKKNKSILNPKSI